MPTKPLVFQHSFHAFRQLSIPRTGVAHGLLSLVRAGRHAGKSRGRVTLGLARCIGGYSLERPRLAHLTIAYSSYICTPSFLFALIYTCTLSLERKSILLGSKVVFSCPSLGFAVPSDQRNYSKCRTDLLPRWPDLLGLAHSQQSTPGRNACAGRGRVPALARMGRAAVSLMETRKGSFAQPAAHPWRRRLVRVLRQLPRGCWSWSES